MQTDTAEKDRNPDIPPQQQSPPGETSAMSPAPDHGERSYRGSGKMAGRAALLPYATTKGAIANFTAGPAQLVADKGVRVNAVAPKSAAPAAAARLLAMPTDRRKRPAASRQRKTTPVTRR